MKIELIIHNATPRVMAALTALMDEIKKSELLDANWEPELIPEPAPAMLQDQADCTEPAPAPAPEVEVDRDGTPWDARIHSSGKSLMKNGLWTKKRGVSKETYDQVIAEITGAESKDVVPSPPPPADVAPPPADVAPPPPSEGDDDLESILDKW